MVGIRRAPKIRHVAARTVTSRQVVIVIYMALSALKTRMSRIQRESRDVVVKVHRSPIHGIVAGSAILGKLGLHVIGVLRSREVLQVATDAIGDGDLIVPVNVAGGAIERGVHSREGESRELAMVESGSK